MGASTYTLTTVDKNRTVFGNKRIVVATFAITVYGTDGVPVDAATLGLGVMDHVIGITLDFDAIGAGGPVAGVWNPTTGHVHFITATNAECGAGALAFTAYVMVMGS